MSAKNVPGSKYGCTWQQEASHLSRLNRGQGFLGWDAPIALGSQGRAGISGPQFGALVGFSLLVMGSGGTSPVDVRCHSAFPFLIGREERGMSDKPEGYSGKWSQSLVAREIPYEKW